MNQTAEDMQPAKLVGTTIDGRYRIDSVLGEGGMGLVYKATQIQLDKHLAVKVLRPDVSRDAEIITRFRQEARSASAIGNQHIIDISDFGSLPDGSAYFVMEHLDGTDLTGAIEERSLTPDRVVHVAKQLCRALGAAHAAGIVHRDLKPDNIFLITRGGDSDFVKVLDFGIAKVGGSSSKLTRAGQVFGTPHYMSPEQCAGSGVDHRTDVYAIGVIMYEMLTGEVPFDADNLMGILTKHLYEAPVPLRERNPSVPEGLEQIVLRAMSKSLDERYESMEALLQDLEHFQSGGVVSSAPVRAPAIPGATEEKSSKLPLVLAAVAAVILAGGIGVWWMGQQNEEVVNVEPPVVEPEPEPLPDPEPEIEPEPEPEQVEVAAPAVMVHVQSQPTGASLWRGTEIIGQTPLDVTRPTGEEPLELELRLEGYQTRAFSISNLTSPDLPVLEMDRVVVRRPGMMRGMRRGEGTMEPTASGMMESAMMSSGMSEVLDPWN